MSVREAQSRIDAREFSEWIAYRAISPFARDRSDYLAASIAYHICTVLAAAHGGSKAAKALKFDDFLLKFGGKKKGRQTTAEQKAIFFAAKAAAEGAVKPNARRHT